MFTIINKLIGVFALTLALTVLNPDTFAADNAAEEGIEEVVVRAHPLSAEGLAQPVSILKSDELNRAASASIGDTLSILPGVNSSSFGQAVGRPVIRGLGGPRVKVMEDRIDTLDVSVSSPDHATTIEPFVANSVEVLKGPSTLLYGSGAIGGVIDVHTGRIPHVVPDKLKGQFDFRGADNADGKTFAGRIDGGSGKFAFHVDGIYRDAGDYDIPGFAESARQRAREEEEGHHDDDDDDHHDDDDDHHDDDDDHHDDDDDHHDEDEEEVFGELPGTELRTEGGAIGLSYVGDRGFVGVSVSSYDARYGLPGHSHHHHHDEEGHDEEGHDEEGHDDDHDDEEHDDEEHGEGEESPPILDLSQTRIDLEAGIEAPTASIRSINLRVGINDYEHVEFEEGEPGTTFKTEATEARLELVHEPLWGITGAAGLQVSTREFSAIGEEAFVQPVDTMTMGLFYVGERKIDDLSLEAGLRFERVEQDPSVGSKQDFDLSAVSFGFIKPIGDYVTLSGQFDHSGRAPVAEELYSNGPHLATQSFEIGDDSLDEEVATNVSIALSYQDESIDVLLSAYETTFDDFIYESNTGMEEDELAVLQWTQADASFSGFEVDARWNVHSWSDGEFTLNLGYERTRAKLDRGANRYLPRIPPQRWRVGAVANWGNFIAELTYQQVSKQDDVADEELPTDSYDDLRLYLGYTIEVERSRIEFFVSGRNLTDDEQRYHTSFIKDLAPHPGRTIEGGVRVQF